jgi:hypothetical protein
MADRNDLTRARTPEEIRREIEQTRCEMDGTMQALSEKLGPRRMAHDAMESAKQTVRDKVSGAASAVKDRVSSAGSAIGEGVAGAADSTKRFATDGARRAKDEFSGMLDENPLALAAIAFGLGLASGLSVPTTRWEDERMGSISTSLKDEAKRFGTETTEKVKRVAQETARAVKDSARNQKDTRATTDAVREAVEQVKGSAKEVVYSARTVAREAAEREGLSGEWLKQQMARVRQAASPAKGPGDR